MLRVSSPSSTYYAAGIGERRFVPLEDGSTVELNTRSSIEVAANSHGREITLLSGEALFNVRHDNAHPFRVVSGGIVIRDIGTTFAVQQQASGANTISVLEGRVEISSTKPSAAGQTGMLPTIVEADQEAAVSQSAQGVNLKVLPVGAAELTRQLAWRDGHLIFMGESLAEVVAKFNRYNRRQIRISDPSVARLALGGVFTTTDFDGMLATITTLFDVRAVPVNGDPNALELQRRHESK